MSEEKAQEEIVSTKVYHSELLDVEVKRKPHCRVTIIAKATPAVLQETKRTALKEIAKEVVIPGFRKGKAPADLIEKKYPAAVTQGWDKAFADKMFLESQKLSSVSLLNGNAKVTYNVTTLNESVGEISFDFEAEPEVPTIEFKSLSLKPIEVAAIDDAKIDETVKNIQMFYAHWNQVENRPVKEGDFVVLDIDDLDQDPPVQAFSNARFEMHEKKMAHWMHKLLLGKNKGDSIEGTSEPNADETEEVKKEFQPKKVKIHLKAIEEALLPEVDDSLAKKLGVDDVATMRSQLKKLLEKQAKDAAQAEQREHIAEALVAAHPFDIPASILEKEANHRMHSLFQQPGFTEKWTKVMSAEEKIAKKDEISKESKHAIALFYICRKLIQDNNITLSVEEFMPQHHTFLEMMFADPNRVNFGNRSKEQQAVEYSRFMISKAEDFVISQLGG